MEVRIGIMQPYFFPYIGYWQLIQNVDVFVLYDDVSYIKGGWVNRNKILVNGKEHLITIPLSGASSNRSINQIQTLGSNHKLLKTISQAYCKSPFFSETFPVIEDALLSSEKNLSLFLKQTIEKLCIFQGIATKILFSSELGLDDKLKSQDKIIEICHRLGGSCYVNPIGGSHLYNRDFFKNKNLQLQFMHPFIFEYEQFSADFIPSLSIIDVLMFNSPGKVSKNFHSIGLE